MSANALIHATGTGRPLKLAGASIAGMGAFSLFALMLVAATVGLSAQAPGGGVSGNQLESFDASARARAEIPPRYLSLYQQAAQRYGLDWTILAGIGRVECDHGQDPDPSCTKEGATNAAGAGGPAQFLATTWSEYGVDADGKGPPDRWDPVDAIFAMANYLKASGAPSDYRKAIYAYNHAWWYVEEVEHWATLYRGPQTTTVSSSEIPNESWQGTGSVQLVAGTHAVLSPADSHVALVPTEAPPVVQAMIVAGNELQDLRYGPTGHPDPRGAESEDCSSTVNYVLYRSGVRPIEEIVRKNPLAQDYVSWGAPGPGRWVTIYATRSPTDHVFIVIAGLRLDTSHNGTDVGPNRDEGGPRWRILDRTPAWAHWSVRHPPGL